jgi:L-malate glycosyltransferase
LRLPAIGITCYPSQGGSGIIATELGLNLARSGYEVHFITSAMPFRLRQYDRNILHHEVQAPNYPVFETPPYTLALATAMMEVARKHRLDILHVHYAIPHAASAFLAQQMLGAERLKTVTTLHGTDITLVGKEPSFHPITRFLIERSDAVTAVSDWLRRETRRVFEVDRPIEVIPNFVDTRLFHPGAAAAADRALFAAPEERLLLHASNFRPVKNVPAVLEVFARVAARLPARLLLIGEGPLRREAELRVDELGLADRVRFLGAVESMEQVLPLADLLLLPSRHESFGLIALEAMACGVPCVATAVGGTGEFIVNGHNGYLRDPADVTGMAEAALTLLLDEEHRRHLGEEGRREVVARFGVHCVLKQYVELYDRLLDRPGGATAS